MGKGKKTDLDYGKNPQQVVPSPDTYKIPTFVDTNTLHKKGFTPLYSREVSLYYKKGRCPNQLYRISL